MRVALLALICTATAQLSQAQSKFSGVLLATNGSGIVAGTVQLSVNGGQVSFQSTLFQAWVTNTHLASTLEVQGDKIAFDLGTGTPGNWPVGQFTGPLSSQTVAPSPNPQFPNLEQIPGPQTLSPGRHFAGSFTVFSELENALLTSGGKISLRVNGTANGMENPTAVEVLVATSPRISNQFATTLSGANEVPPHACPFHGKGSFTLEGNSLTYDLVVLDIMGVRGFDLLQLAVAKNLPVIMLTAHAATPNAIKKSIELGARAYLLKDELADVPAFLEDVLQLNYQEVWKKSLDTTGVVFGKKFGPEWRISEKEFWQKLDNDLKLEKSVIIT